MNYYINGIRQAPVFKVYSTDTTPPRLIKTIEMPLCMEAIKYKAEREIDVIEYLCGRTGVEVLGYKHNWSFDYEKFMYSENIFNLFLELIEYADSPNHILKVKALSDSQDDMFIDCVIMNKEFLLSLIYEGIKSKGYEGINLEVRSVERYPTFWNGWRLVNPSEVSNLNFEVGEPIIAN